MAYAELTTEPLDLDALTKRVQGTRYGGYVTFSGDVRDHDVGKPVAGIVYQAYEDLARKEMARICQEAEARWPGVACAVEHRIGRLEIGESSIIIAVAAPHRAEAFEACRWMIDTIKTTVPIWKREEYSDAQEVWIEGNHKIAVLRQDGNAP